MIALLGRACVLLAALFGFLGLAVGWAGAHRAWARRMTLGLAASFAVAVLGANLILELALLRHDFSVSYVAEVGALSSPAWISAVSLWSALDGSILFWLLVLAGFTAALAWRRRRFQTAEGSTALSILLGLGAAFASLLLLAANPFRDVWPPPADGPGPNPLLQNHLLMAIHPPVLYAGEVGMAVPFALAAAALRSGHLSREAAAAMRCWLLVPWSLLTAGIALGARWAYDVLGWGGYWSWDPVENASLMPWLAATAALHALKLSERRSSATLWALVLTQSTLLLSLLGTFLTRSGVVASVHSFAPGTVGTALLGLLGAALIFSVVLLALRASAFQEAWKPQFVIARSEATKQSRGASGLLRFARNDECQPWTLDRQAAYAANNLVLGLITFAVLLGTLYPVALRALTGARTGIGEEYFNGFAVPLGIALLFLMGIGPALPFGRVAPRAALRRLLPPLCVGFLAAAIAALIGARSPGLLATVGCAGFAISVSARQVLTSLHRMAGPGGRVRRQIGAHLAHLGIAATLVAVAASSSGRRSVETVLHPGESAKLGAYQLTFQGAQRAHERHRDSYSALFAVARGGQELGPLAPRLSFYFATQEALGAPAVRSSPLEDLYVSLLRLDPEKREVAIRVQLAPLVAWLWIGVGLTVLGGLLALPFGRRALTPTSLRSRRGVTR